jgi:site-specific recombinase XerD
MPCAAASITREHVEAYIVSLQREGKRPATQNLAYRSLQPFWKWALEEGEISVSPMARMKPPVVPVNPPPVLKPEEVQRLMKVCDGTDFEARRDRAVISLLMDTGMRRGELAGLATGSIDFAYDQVIIEGDTSKSRRTRVVRFGKDTARALDRYIRVRRRHVDAELPNLWLGKRGPMTGSGLLQMLERRGQQADIVGLHPHQFRHTFAHEMLSSGFQEGDLMQLGGWKDRGMLSRYGASAAAERARENYRSPVDRLGHRDANGGRRATK